MKIEINLPLVFDMDIDHSIVQTWMSLEPELREQHLVATVIQSMNKINVFNKLNQGSSWCTVYPNSTVR